MHWSTQDPNNVDYSVFVEVLMKLPSTSSKFNYTFLNISIGLSQILFFYKISYDWFFKLYLYCSFIIFHWMPISVVFIGVVENAIKLLYKYQKKERKAAFQKFMYQQNNI